MTDILFKAKTYSDGGWVTSPTVIRTGDMIHMPAPDDECEVMYDLSSAGPGNILSIPRCKFYRVHPETLCRYTGMKRELDDRMIWEYDLLKHIDTDDDEDPFYGIVKYGTYQSQPTNSHSDTNCIGYYVDWLGAGECRLYRKELYFWVNYDKFAFRNKVEIIGSVFDYPEIMKEYGIS